ncbi:MAG: hypothetical protein WC782_03900 [Methylococcaceae bacterium]|jgi:chromosome segregation ATPase
MKLTSKSTLLLTSYIMVSLSIGPCFAASREAAGGSNKIVGKLQAMVRDVTSERDQLKAENDKLNAELEKVKQEKSAAISASAAVEEKLNSVDNELSAQKNSNAEVRSKLEQTHAKLLEVIEKYKMLNQAKNDLSQQYANLDNTQKQTASELLQCEDKNIKMFEAGQEVLNRYENKGVFDSLLQAEPMLQLKSVEMENLVQEYEDKLRKQKYQPKAIAATAAPVNIPPQQPIDEPSQDNLKPAEEAK